MLTPTTFFLIIIYIYLNTKLHLNQPDNNNNKKKQYENTKRLFFALKGK
jgi:hypothetical protein